MSTRGNPLITESVSDAARTAAPLDQGADRGTAILTDDQIVLPVAGHRSIAAWAAGAGRTPRRPSISECRGLRGTRRPARAPTDAAATTRRASPGRGDLAIAGDVRVARGDRTAAHSTPRCRRRRAPPLARSPSSNCCTRSPRAGPRRARFTFEADPAAQAPAHGRVGPSGTENGGDVAEAQPPGAPRSPWGHPGPGTAATVCGDAQVQRGELRICAQRDGHQTECSAFGRR